MTALGKYLLEKKLATGGMAEVWLAKQQGIEGFNRHVVIKRILPHLAADPEFVQMFLNEARIAAKFNHPNIAQIYDFGEVDGAYYIAMEFIHGEDLGRVMRRAFATDQWIALPLALRIAASACEGLFYAHSRKDDAGRPLNIVHRDVSPQNILLSFDGSVKLVDFGIAKAADSASHTQSGAIKGKFAYMAPEQAGSHPLDARTDIFSLGLILYELVTGVRALKRETEIATLQAALTCQIDAPSVVAEVPSQVDELVMKALSKDPSNRYRDARAFLMAIEEYLMAERMVATSAQISELMDTLFADRLAEEARSGMPSPSTQSKTDMPMQSARATPEASTGSAEMVDDADVMSDADATRAETTPGKPFDGTASQSATSAQGRRKKATSSISYSAAGSAVARSTGSGQAPRQSQPMPEVEISLSHSNPLEEVARRSRSSSGPQMPVAPPRRISEAPRPKVAPISKSRVEPARPVAESEGTDALSVSRAPLTAQRPSVAKWALLFVAALSAAVGVYLLGNRFAPARKPDASGRAPLVLTVNSRPTTRVSVRSPQGVLRALGDTPLSKVSGAFVGDTLVLSNEPMGISYEQPLESTANGELRFEKLFAEGHLKLIVKPQGQGLTLWRGSQRLGSPEMTLNLYEGRYHLELRGETLNTPVGFDVVIAGGKTAQETVVLPQ